MAEQTPTLDTGNINQLLTSTVHGWIQSDTNFAYNRAFPNVPTPKNVMRYYVFDREQSLRNEAAPRPLGAEAELTQTKVSTTPFALESIALAEDVDDRVRTNSDAPFAPEEDALRGIMQKMHIFNERQMVDDLMKNQVWFNGMDTAQDAQAVTWSDSAGTPLRNLDAAGEGIAKYGFAANTLICSLTAFNTLRRHDDITALFPVGGTGTTPLNVTEQALANALGLERVIVSRAADSNGRIMGNQALLCYSGPVGTQRAPSAARRFSWTGEYGTTNEGIRVGIKRKDLADSNRVQAEMASKIFLTGGELGWLFNVS